MSKVFIIGEAGVNHNGSLELAKKMVDVACQAGVDAIKFQTFKAVDLVTQAAPRADYQKLEMHDIDNESQYSMLRKLELSQAHHQEIADYCRIKKILFLSSPFDKGSIDFLSRIGMSIYKIPSGEITNYPYLKHVSRMAKEIILSTGMADLVEIENALNVLISEGIDKSKITVLHATSEYPCPFDEVNLHAMLTIKKTFDVKVGYSDHTTGITIPIAAAALGAQVIEKHFTIDKTMSGPDHKASLEPRELEEMVKAIRNIEKSLGDGIKCPSPSEIKNIAIVRKSIVAVQNIKKGDIFTEKNLGLKRPGNGLSPIHWDAVIGQVACRSFQIDEQIEL